MCTYTYIILYIYVLYIHICILYIYIYIYTHYYYYYYYYHDITIISTIFISYIFSGSPRISRPAVLDGRSQPRGPEVPELHRYLERHRQLVASIHLPWLYNNYNIQHGYTHCVLLFVSMLNVICHNNGVRTGKLYRNTSYPYSIRETVTVLCFNNRNIYHDICTVGFHNFNLRIFNLRVSNPNKLIADVVSTRCRISMCQGLGPQKNMKFRKSTVSSPKPRGRARERRR